MNESGIERVKGDNLDSQFERARNILIGNENIAAVDIAPENLTDRIPVIFAPGWTGTLPVYKQTIKTIAKEGRRTISFNHPRNNDDIPLSKEGAEMVKEYPTEQVRKAQTMIRVLEELGVKKADVVAHSEGGAYTAIAALLRPDLFRDVVLFNPAGLVKKNVVKLAWDAQKQSYKPLDPIGVVPTPEEERIAKEKGFLVIGDPNEKELDEGKAVADTAGRESVSYVLANPWRAAKEVWGLSQVEIKDILIKLHEGGIGITIFGSDEDPIYSSREMQNVLKDTGIKFISVNPGHGVIGEQVKYTQLAARELENLNKKRVPPASSLMARLREQEGKQPTKPTSLVERLRKIGDES